MPGVSCMCGAAPVPTPPHRHWPEQPTSPTHPRPNLPMAQNEPQPLWGSSALQERSLELWMDLTFWQK